MPTSTTKARGPVATADMKNRIRVLKEEGEDVLEALWERMERAEIFGLGYTYELASDNVETTQS